MAKWMPHNFKIPQASHEYLSMTASHNLTKLLHRKPTDVILALIDVDTREQLKLIAKLFSRQKSQKRNTNKEPRVPLTESKTAPPLKIEET